MHASCKEQMEEDARLDDPFNLEGIIKPTFECQQISGYKNLSWTKTGNSVMRKKTLFLLKLLQK